MILSFANNSTEQTKITGGLIIIAEDQTVNVSNFVPAGSSVDDLGGSSAVLQVNGVEIPDGLNTPVGAGVTLLGGSSQGTDVLAVDPDAVVYDIDVVTILGIVA